MNEEMLHLAMTVEQVKAQGLAMGLTRTEVDEVMQAWAEWSSVRVDPVPWDRVSTSMTLRAMEKEWRP